MCEKRTRKLKKGSQVTRLREARRLQRLQWLAAPQVTRPEFNYTPTPTPTTTAHVVVPPRPIQPQVDRAAQNRAILELTWRTVALMQKNKLIQQKIIELRKETSEFLASVMNNPENRQRYEQYRLQGLAQAQLQPQNVPGDQAATIKTEPKV